MGVFAGVTTSELDELAAETAASMTSKHPDYAQLAARIAVSNLHKTTKKSFSETMKMMYDHVNERNGKWSPLLADDVNEVIVANAERLDAEIVYDRDFDYDYFCADYCYYDYYHYYCYYSCFYYHCFCFLR